MPTITEDFKHTGQAVRDTAAGLLREAAALSHTALESETAEQVAHTVRLRLKRGRRALENAVDKYEDAVQCVKRQPLLAIAVTLASGVLIGVLVGRALGKARSASPGQ